MTAVINDHLYLADYTDEEMPCAPTLAAWQDWLAQPDADWGRTTPPADGQMFDGWRQTITWHRVTGVDADALTVTLDPPAPQDMTAVVLADGPGDGWCADDICNSLAELVYTLPIHPGSTVAVMGHSRPTRLQWQGGRLVEIGNAQIGGAA
ncbi:hypothetical protein ACEYYA_00780 [Paracoccus sp. p3-h83]|uniref:hypothetical protein n=1 Tax=Paracoccus sp. p3-h83 TaxID=3342805 RepID=UPI0035BA31CF